jgi:hypothetical protein
VSPGVQKLRSDSECFLGSGGERMGGTRLTLAPMTNGSRAEQQLSFEGGHTSVHSNLTADHGV